VGIAPDFPPWLRALAPIFQWEDNEVVCNGSHQVHVTGMGDGRGGAGGRGPGFRIF